MNAGTEAMPERLARWLVAAVVFAVVGLVFVYGTALLALVQLAKGVFWILALPLRAARALLPGRGIRA